MLNKTKDRGNVIFFQMSVVCYPCIICILTCIYLLAYAYVSAT